MSVPPRVSRKTPLPTDPELSRAPEAMDHKPRPVSPETLARRPPNRIKGRVGRSSLGAEARCAWPSFDGFLALKRDGVKTGLGARRLRPDCYRETGEQERPMP
jgi:hypothetical protein